MLLTHQADSFTRRAFRTSFAPPDQRRPPGCGSHGIGCGHSSTFSIILTTEVDADSSAKQSFQQGGTVDPLEAGATARIVAAECVCSRIATTIWMRSWR